MKTKEFYTAITTDDMDKSLSFYVGTLGFHVQHEINAKTSHIVVLENEKGAKIDLIETPGKAGGFKALRTNVDDLESAYHELSEGGYEIIGEPINITTGKALLVKDPNGVLINITQHIKKTK